MLERYEGSTQFVQVFAEEHRNGSPQTVAYSTLFLARTRVTRRINADHYHSDRQRWDSRVQAVRQMLKI